MTATLSQFESLPAGGRKAEKRGMTELDKSFHKVIYEKVPSLTETLELTELFDAWSYPFPDQWSPSLKRMLELEFCWTVEGLHFRETEEDQKNNWFPSHRVNKEIDVPAALVKTFFQNHKNTSEALDGSIDESQTKTVVMGFKSLVSVNSLPHQSTQMKLRISSPGFSPVLTGDFEAEGPSKECWHRGTRYNIAAYSKSNIPIPAMGDSDGNEKTLRANLSLVHICIVWRCVWRCVWMCVCACVRVCVCVRV